jgi:hypothetical protein
VNLAKDFTTAWQKLKGAATEAATWVAKQAPVVNKVVAVASATVEALDPAVAPVVTTFDNLEEALVGEVTNAIGAITTAPSPESFFTIQLPGTFWPALKAIEQTLLGKSAVTPAKS